MRRRAKIRPFLNSMHRCLPTYGPRSPPPSSRPRPVRRPHELRRHPRQEPGQAAEDDQRPERLEKKGVKILQWQYQSHKGYQKGFN